MKIFYFSTTTKATAEVTTTTQETTTEQPTTVITTTEPDIPEHYEGNRFLQSKQKLKLESFRCNSFVDCSSDIYLYGGSYHLSNLCVPEKV